MFDKAVDGELKRICLDMEARYQLKFLEIGTYEVKIARASPASYA